MELSITLNHIRRGRSSTQTLSLERAARLCREAGFRYVNFLSDIADDHWEARAYQARELLDREGLVVEQSHAPFNRYNTYDAQTFHTLFSRSFQAARILGAEHVVVHADEYRTTDHYDPMEIQSLAYEMLAPQAEFVKKNGMKLAIENLFEDHATSCVEIDGKSRFTSRVEEQVGLIERFADPSVCGCWDFGHAACAFGVEGMLPALQKVGRRIGCTHVHDNNKRQDQHQMPFLGEIDWQGQMAALREMGYTGKLTLEYVYGGMPEDMMSAWLSLQFAVGQKLISLQLGAGEA